MMRHRARPGTGGKPTASRGQGPAHEQGRDSRPARARQAAGPPRVTPRRPRGARGPPGRPGRQAATGTGARPGQGRDCRDPLSHEAGREAKHQQLRGRE